MRHPTPRPVLACLSMALGAILVLAAPVWANQASEQFTQSGEAKFAQQDYDGALADFRAGIKADPQDDANFISAGLVMLTKKQFAEALAYFDQALKLTPNNPDAHHGRGQALLGLGRKAEAKASFQTVLKLEPDNQGARYFLNQLQ